MLLQLLSLSLSLAAAIVAAAPAGYLQESRWANTSSTSTALNVSSVQLFAAAPEMAAGVELWLNVSGTVVSPVNYTDGVVDVQIWELGAAVSAVCCAIAS